MQIQDHSKIEPAFAGPDIGNVTSPFLVWSICCKVPIQQVGRDVKFVITAPLSADCFAIACRAMVVTLCLRVLMTDMPFWRIHCLAIVTCNDEKVSAHATMANIQANLFQVLSHARPAIAAKAETRLFLYVGQSHHIRPLPTACRPSAERTQTTRADIHDMTHPAN